MVWNPALGLLQESIDEKGYFYCPYSFKKFAKEQGMEASGKTPEYVSINFWLEQDVEFKNRGWYVTRLSGGRFGVFSEEVFPKPYTALSINSVENLKVEKFSSRPHIEEAFKLMMEKSSAENATLEMLRFGGIWDSFIERFSGSNRYKVGPRGGFWHRFNLHMRKKNQDFITFKYSGQTELDYSLWTDDRIFVIEAKSQKQNGFDIGWHKLAFPAQYYSEIAQKYEVDIVPVYLLRHFSNVDNKVFLFVFPPYEPYNEGLLLNDQKAMTPDSIIKVDLTDIISISQQKLDTFSR